MKSFNFGRIAGYAAVLVTPVVFLSIGMPVAHAGTIILEGSDAVGFHCPGGNASACTYTAQLWEAIDGASDLPIAVFGTNDEGTPTTSEGATVQSGPDMGDPITITNEGEVGVGTVGPLSGFAALYFLAGNGCCSEDDSLITGDGATTAANEAAVMAYLAGGGTVVIENYTGGTAWNFAIDPGAPSTNLNNFVAGIDGGQSSSLSCDDGETVTATGIANGFTQPGVMNCWTHQAYDMSAFAPLGFTESFFNSPADGGYTGTGPYSSLLSDGNTLSAPPTGTPEPASMLLMGSGLAALGFVARRRSGRKA
ncbi:MAG TPA: PEP-CTERM sorting domain-containing protein [Bryobacteraceae bacterium]|jgi:hypothetical protein